MGEKGRREKGKIGGGGEVQEGEGKIGGGGEVQEGEGKGRRWGSCI